MLTFSLLCCKKVAPTSGGTSGGNDVFSLTGKKLVFMGDSITFSQGWTTPITTNYGGTQINLAANGQVLENMGVFHQCNGTTQLDPSLAPVYDSTYGAIFIAIGVNDIGFNNGTTTPSNYETTYLSVIDYLHFTKQWPYSKIVVLTPYYMTMPAGASLYPPVTACGANPAADATRRDAFEQKVRDVSFSKNVKLVDVSNWFKAQPDPAALLTDGVHPNSTGYTQMSNYIISVLDSF
jgi:lysophospholipase L1-like esterase